MTTEHASVRPHSFLEERPAGLHQPKPWHRLAYHMRTLPEGLERLAATLPTPPGVKVLDYGCATVPYRRFFPADAEYAAADLPGNPRASLHLAPDGTVPAADESFDIVLSTQVLEHVADPALYVSECFRVLRPGGRLLLSTHGTMVYHPDPVDYWRWTCAGLRRVVADAGLEVERFEGIMGLAATGLQLLQESVYFRIPWPWAQNLLALVMQGLIAIADRLEPQASRDMNAFAFALVARKP